MPLLMRRLATPKPTKRYRVLLSVIEEGKRTLTIVRVSMPYRSFEAAELVYRGASRNFPIRHDVNARLTLNIGG